MNLTLFDLDHTLLNGDSDGAWSHFLTEKGLLNETDKVTGEAFFRQYLDGTLNIHDFLRFQLSALKNNPRHRLDSLREEFTESILQPLVRPDAIKWIKQHQSENNLIAVVTATNSFVTAKIVQFLNIHHLVATIPACNAQGEFTGEVRGIPCFQSAKITRVEAWLESLGLFWGSFDNTSFYSDSHNDIPLLKKVDSAVAVTPDPTLRAFAEKNNWPILEC